MNATTRLRTVELGEIIAPAPGERVGNDDMPVLSMTMHDGLVDQSAKFKKRVASEDLSACRAVRRGQLVVGFPIDEGVLSFQNLYDRAAVSPAYGVWNLRHAGSVDGAYLESFLRSPQALGYYAAKLRSTTARRRSLDRGTFLALPVFLPPLAEQKRIAAILDQADALRRLRRRAVDRLNTLGQAIFQEMFVEALQGRFFEFGRVVQDFRYGTSNKSGDTGLPTLRIPNVIGGRIDTTETKTVEVTQLERERLRLQDGDVLFVRTNGNPDYVGRCAAFSSSDLASNGDRRKWIFASYLIRARLSERINPVFATTYFATQLGRASVRERCKTSAGHTIST